MRLGIKVIVFDLVFYVICSFILYWDLFFITILTFVLVSFIVLISFVFIINYQVK